MPNGEPWFEASDGSGHVQFASPGPSAPVTVEGAGNWTWAVLGMPVSGHRVHVEPSEEHRRKAS